jgi:hypothetical protein
MHRNKTQIMIYFVTTLALGSRAKQLFARLQTKREVGSHTTYSWECEKVWGNETSHPKGVRIPVDFWISKGRLQGLNSMAWRIIYIIGKLLECKYLKWARIAHLDIWNTSYGQKKGPLKVENRPDFHACRWRATYCWKALNEGYNFASDLISIKVCMQSYGAPKSRESQPWQFQNSHLGVSRQKAIWMWALWRGVEYTIRGKVVASPSPSRGESCVSVLPVARPNTKGVPTMH